MTWNSRTTWPPHTYTSALKLNWHIMLQGAYVIAVPLAVAPATHTQLYAAQEAIHEKWLFARLAAAEPSTSTYIMCEPTRKKQTVCLMWAWLLAIHKYVRLYLCVICDQCQSQKIESYAVVYVWRRRSRPRCAQWVANTSARLRLKASPGSCLHFHQRELQNILWHFSTWFS